MNWKIILAITVILVLIIYGSVKIAHYRFQSSVDNDLALLTGQKSSTTTGVITEQDLAGLPEPVQRYLRYSNIIGKQPIRTVRLKQKGKIWTAPDKGHMEFSATEYFSTEPGGFVWEAEVDMLPGLSLLGKDRYINGQGSMLIKFLGLFTVVDAKGFEMDQGSMLRYINEHIWFPTAFLNEYFEWFTIDDVTAEARVTFGRQKSRIIYYFNEEGQMINFETERYRSLEDGRFESARWSTPFSDYKEIGGFRVPTAGKGIWHLQDRDFKYIDLTVDDILYDVDLSRNDS